MHFSVLFLLKQYNAYKKRFCEQIVNKMVTPPKKSPRKQHNQTANRLNAIVSINWITLFLGFF